MRSTDTRIFHIDSVSHITPVSQQNVSKFIQTFCSDKTADCAQNTYFLNQHAIGFVHYLSLSHPNYQHVLTESTLINAARWSNIITDDDIDIVLFVSKNEYMGIINNDTNTINKFESIYKGYSQISHCTIGWTAVLHKCYLNTTALNINNTMHPQDYSFLIDIHYAYVDQQLTVTGYPYLRDVQFEYIFPARNCLLGTDIVLCPNKPIQFLRSWYEKNDTLPYLHDPLIYPPELPEKSDENGIRLQIIDSVRWLYNNKYVSLCDGENHQYCFQ